MSSFYFKILNIQNSVILIFSLLMATNAIYPFFFFFFFYLLSYSKFWCSIPCLLCSLSHQHCTSISLSFIIYLYIYLLLIINSFFFSVFSNFFVYSIGLVSLPCYIIVLTHAVYSLCSMSKESPLISP